MRPAGDRCESEESARAHVHLFSVDVEEYFQVNAFDASVSRSDWPAIPSRLEIGVDRLLELLDHHQAYATFFTLGWIARARPAVVRRIAEAGHEIASHGWTHRRLSSLTPLELRGELRDSRRALEDVAGTPVLGFRAPSFSITPGREWAFDVLVEEGYRYDSSLFPVRRPGYGYPRAPAGPHLLHRRSGTLLELPLATRTLIGCRLPAAGGGYLRQLPYSLTVGAVREAESRGTPAMIYIHPWELDPEQPRLPVHWLTRIRHYRGLRRVQPLLGRLLGRFRFTSVQRSPDPLISSHITGASSRGAAALA